LRRRKDDIGDICQTANYSGAPRLRMPLESRV
jgi:hypothetical protein